jgi:hypothetical protein
MIYRGWKGTIEKRQEKWENIEADFFICPEQSKKNDYVLQNY